MNLLPWAWALTLPGLFLTAAGVGIEDTPDGPIWTLKDDES